MIVALALALVAGVPPCEGTIAGAFAVDALKGPRDFFVEPDAETLRAIGDSLSSMLDEAPKRRPDYVFALERASISGYELCREEEIFLFRPVKAGIGHPVFAINTADDAASLIIEVPHTFFDRGTRQQGLEAFIALGARALIVAGGHRCASEKVSSCDGSSSVCSDESGPFRASDMAHATETIFQIAHRIIADHHREDLVLSLHGMDMKGAVLSDGTTIETSSTAIVKRLAEELESMLPAEKIRLCNERDDSAPSDLCGTTNVQGRHVNGAEDACREQPARSSGRFLHLEQSPRFRRQNETLIEALKRVLPQPPT